LKNKFKSFFVRRSNYFPSIATIETMFEIYDPVVSLPTTELCEIMMDIIDTKSQSGESLWRGLTIKKQFTGDPLYIFVQSKFQKIISELKNTLSTVSDIK